MRVREKEITINREKVINLRIKIDAVREMVRESKIERKKESQSEKERDK